MPAELCQTTIDRICESISTNQPIVADHVSSSDFRDICQRLKGNPNVHATFWMMIFTQQQVIAQPLHRPDVLVIIQDSDLKFFSKHHFDYLNETDAAFFGTFNGKYSFLSFVKDVFRKRWCAAYVIMFAFLFLLGYLWLRPASILNISQGLIQALAIFVTILVLFVLSLNPEQDFRLAESDRFHKFAQTDRYIAVWGMSTLLISILACSVASAYTHATPLYYSIQQALGQSPPVPWSKIKMWDYEMFIIAFLFSISSVGTLSSYWLVLVYHFGRRQEMTQMLMAKYILANQQDLAREAAAKRYHDDGTQK